jgi:hypothetical protein
MKEGISFLSFFFFCGTMVRKTMFVISKPDAADVLLHNFYNETFEYITAPKRH